MELNAERACSNRTFMELKYGLNSIRCTTKGSSNRTFMELKYGIIDFTAKEHGVLIVPLWN